jgi:hypothetical protein
VIRVSEAAAFPAESYPQTARCETEMRAYLRRPVGERLVIDCRLMGEGEAWAFAERVMALGRRLEGA